MGFFDSIMTTLVGGAPKVTMPPAIQAQIEQLNYIPFGPERDALQQSIQNTYGITTDQLNNSLGQIQPAINQFGQQAGDIGNQLSGVAKSLQTMGGYNPYMVWGGNPQAKLNDYLKNRESQIAATFNPYGQQGAASQMSQGLMKAQQGRQGITNSGVARRQMEEENLRLMNAKQAAQSQAATEGNNYIAQLWGLYNQGLQGQGQLQSQAANVYGQQGDLASKVPAMQIQAAQTLGALSGNQANQLAGMQSESRTGQQNVANWNAENRQSVYNNYAGAQNTRNVNQASLDAQRRKPGLMDLISPIAQMAIPAAGLFMGGGGGGASGGGGLLSGLFGGRSGGAAQPSGGGGLTGGGQSYGVPSFSQSASPNYSYSGGYTNPYPAPSAFNQNVYGNTPASYGGYSAYGNSGYGNSSYGGRDILGKSYSQQGSMW